MMKQAGHYSVTSTAPGYFVNWFRFALWLLLRPSTLTPNPGSLNRYPKPERSIWAVVKVMAPFGVP